MILMKSCEECNKQYKANGQNKYRQRFCSDRCRDIEYRRNPNAKEYHKLYNRKYMRTSKWLTYQQKYWKIKNKKERLELMVYLGGPKCLECGSENYNKPRLEFHHIDPKHTKEDRLRFKDARTMVRYYRKNVEEAKQKLQVLCGLCNSARNRKY